MKDELLATISRELRTPLTSVLGYTELLEDLGPDQVGDDARAFIEVINRSALRELRLVDDLLTLITIGNGDLSIQAAVIDLDSLVLEAVESAEPLAHAADVVLCLSSVGQDVHVHGVADRLGQALDNLISNAIKFSPPGTEILIDVCGDDEMVTIEVTGHGPGIADGDLAHVFDRLYRGKQARETEKQGAGLGLPIVKAIVDSHHGKVSVNSEPGASATFQILLPRVVSEPHPHGFETVCNDSRPQ